MRLQHTVSAAALLVVLCSAVTGGVVLDEAARAGSADSAAPAIHVAGSKPGSPWFCHGLDCPHFRVVDTTPDYEVREYAPGVWVSTDVQAYFYMHAATQGFRRLFKYIDGQNEEGVKVPMTAPVATKIQASAGPFCKSNYTVSFFVPHAQQEAPPQPSNPDVHISHSPAFTAYVAQSGGLTMDDWSISKMASGVLDALEAEGRGGDVFSSFFYFAGYDPPFRLRGRHSEVWIVGRPAAGSADDAGGQTDQHEQAAAASVQEA